MTFFNPHANWPKTTGERHPQKVAGFTGTRRGMTDEQKARVRELLLMLKPDIAIHGDCVGADADFDAICEDIGIPRLMRPCTIDSMRAFTKAEQLAEPDNPMARNRAIVADASYLIACPPSNKYVERGSGTWATIGFAEEADKERHIVYPDGSYIVADSATPRRPLARPR